jgi:hypothetical protein
MRRLRTIARKKGLCPLHMTPLVCITCAARRGGPSWAGTQDELEELFALDDRMGPYRDQIPAAGVCPLFRCGGKLFCEPCYNAAAARIVVPDDLYTPDERVRLHELMGLLGVKETPGRNSYAL